MALLKWVHISDIHIKSVGEHLARYKSDIVLRALWNDVYDRCKISDELRDLDFAFVTGDIAWSGADDESSDEYVEVYKRVIEPLVAHTGLPLDRIFVVPGNHDVSRSRIKDDVKKIESDLTDRDSILRLFVEPDRDDDRAKMFGRLDQYAAFVQKRLRHLQIDPRSLAFSNWVKCSGLKEPVRIIGLNSAWFSRGGKEDLNSIVLGEPLIDELLHEAGRGQCLTIVLVHHPLKEAAAWYKDTEDKALNMIRSAAGFVLAGHVHKSDVLSQFSPLGACIEIVAGSIYDGDAWASSSYNYVCFDTETHRGRVFLRRYRDDVVPEPEWQRDLISTGKAKNGIVDVGLRLDEMCGERGSEPTAVEGDVGLLKAFVKEQCAELDKRPLLSQPYADRDSVGVLFPNVYVDPLVSPQRYPLGTPIPLSEWVCTHWNEAQKVLLIGPAGTGKTTSLISIQHQCAEAFVDNAAGRVPVFIEARRLKWRTPPDREAVVNKVISGCSEGVKSLADGTVDVSRWLVLIDGIDEAFPGAYREMDTFDPSRVTLPFPHIFTCRDDFFRRNLSGAEFCRHYDEILFVEPWTIDREVPLFLENYCLERDPQIDEGKRKELLGLVEGFARAQATCLTPLVVTTILFLWRYDYEHTVHDRPTTFASLLGRFLTIWARREVESLACAFQSGGGLLQAYEDAAWMLYEARISQKPLRVRELMRGLSKNSGLREAELLEDRGLLSVLRTETGDLDKAGAEVVSFLHEALHEYLLARRATQALTTGGARGPIAGRLLGHSVNRLARQILSCVRRAERSSMVVRLENEYFRLHRSARGRLGRLIRGVKSKLFGADWEAKMIDEGTVRRMNLCYFWGRLEADLGGQRINELFHQLVHGTLVEHEMIVNTVGSSILLLDDAPLERIYIERLSDDGPLARCNRSYHRIYYGDAGYTSPDGLLRDDFVFGRDDWVRTRQAILSRLNSQEDRDIRLRSLDLVTFRRLCETRGVPALTSDELAIISDCVVGVDILTDDRKAVMEEELSRLSALLASGGPEGGLLSNGDADGIHP